MVKAERFTPSSAPMLPGAMDIGEPERAAVLSALDPAYIAKMANESPSSSCSWIYKFERAFTNAMNVRYGTATNSGTAALFASLVALGIEPGDEVIIPAYSYISCAAATLNAGGIPVIADVDASLTLDPAAVRTSLSAYTKVIMVVHMRGVPAQLTALKTIAAESRTTLVEDASQACGATYQGRPVGGHGAVGCFSFDPTKIISSDQGGMVVTDDPRIDLRVRCAADPEWQPGDDRSRCPDRPFTGLNLKMSHIAAALATAQLQRLPSLIDRMRERQALLTEAIARHGRFVMRSVPDNACEVGNSVVFFAESPTAALTVRQALREHGVMAHVLYVEGEHNWRVYRCWHDVLAQRGRGATTSPWSAARRTVTYDADMCRSTLSLLTRAVHLDVSPQLSLTDTSALAGMLARLTPVGFS
jgi:8-amino-3,8-dideoxy-alpha-D-manno-octulosonate transaminase